jgi:hypothetical protein
VTDVSSECPRDAGDTEIGGNPSGSSADSIASPDEEYYSNADLTTLVQRKIIDTY